MPGGKGKIVETQFSLFWFSQACELNTEIIMGKRTLI
jgi:hypothetical protein